MSFETTCKVTFTLHIPGDRHDIDRDDFYHFIRTKNGASIGDIKISDILVEKFTPIKDQKMRKVNLYKKMLKEILGEDFKFKMLWYHGGTEFNIGIYDTKIETNEYNNPAENQMRDHYFKCSGQKITLFMPCFSEYEWDVKDGKSQPPGFDINNPHVWEDIKKTFFNNYKARENKDGG